MPTEEEIRQERINRLFPEGVQTAPGVTVESGVKFGDRPESPLDQPKIIESIPFSSAADVAFPGEPPPAISNRERMNKIIEKIKVRKQADFIESEFLKQEEAAGTDLTTGGPAGFRAKLSVTSNEITQLNLFRKHFKKVRFTPLGPIVTPHNSDQEFLLDETGITWKDFADITGTALELGGAVAAAGVLLLSAPPALATSAIMLPVLTVFAALGGEFTVATSAQFIVALKDGNMDLTEPEGLNRAVDILKDEGINAFINATINALLLGGYGSVQILKSIIQKGPKKTFDALKDILGRKPSKVESEFQELTADALETFPTIKEAATPALRTGLRPVTQLQGFLKGQPGGEILVAKEAVERESILEVQKGLAVGRQTIQEFGKDSSAILALQEKNVADSIITQGVYQELLTKNSAAEAVALARGRIKQIGEMITPGDTSMILGGESARHGILMNFTKFDELQSTLARRSDKAMSVLDKRKGEHLFATPVATKRVIKKLRTESSRTPTGKVIESTVKKGVSDADLLLQQISNKKGKTSIDELRKLRRQIDDSIGDPEKFAGISDTQKKLIAGALSDDIRRAAVNAPTQKIRDTLLTELDHYKNGIGAFRDSHVVRVFKKEGSVGTIADEDIAPNLFFTGSGKAREKILAAQKAMGPDSDSWRTVRKSVYNELRIRSTDTMASVGGTPIVSGRRLSGHLKAMEDNGVLKILIPDQVEREELKRLAGLLEGQQGLDAENFLRAFNTQTPTEVSIVKEMRRSIDTDKALQEKFFPRLQESLRKGIVPSELDPDQVFVALRKATEGQPSQFVRNVLAMDTDQLKIVLAALPPASRVELREHAAAVLLERGASNATELEKVLAMVRGETPISRELIASMSATAELSAVSLNKVQLILGPEKFELLKKFGVIGQRIREIDKATDVGGALAKGATYSQLSKGAFAKAFGKIGGVRVASHLLLEGETAIHKIMGRKFVFKDVKKSRLVLTASLPQWARLMSETILSDNALTQYLEETTGKEVLTLVQDFVGFLGGVQARREFGTDKGVSPGFIQKFAGQAFPRDAFQPPASPEQVTNELFNLAPGSAVRPIP